MKSVVARRYAARWSCLLLLCWAAGLAAAEGRAFTVDDLLNLEAFGAIMLDPTGRTLIIERRGPYQSAPRFDYGYRNDIAASRLLRVDLVQPAAATPLMPQQDDAGYLAGEFSPGGERLVVYRLMQRKWELGVVTVASGEVRWFDVTPPDQSRVRAVHWLSANELLVIARPPGEAPLDMRTGWQMSTLLPDRWAAAARGELASTVFGSGAHLAARARPAPGRLLRVDVRNGESKLLATGLFVDMEVSRSGRFVALASAGEDIQPTALQPLHGNWGTATEQRRISVLDLTSSELAAPFADCDALASLLSWSPSGDRLLAYCRRPGTDWSSGRLMMFDAGRQQAVSLDIGKLTLRFRFRPEALRTAWIGRSPAVLASEAGKSRADWWRLSERHPVNLTARLPEPAAALAADSGGLTVLSGDSVWRVDSSGAVRGPLEKSVTDGIAARGGQRFRDSFVVASSRDRAEVVLSSRESNHVVRIDARGGAHRVPMKHVDGDRVAYSSASGTLVVVRRDAWGMQSVELHTSSVQPVLASQVNAYLAEVAQPRVVEIRHRAPEGQPVSSWLYMPPGGSSHRPLIVRPYLGDNYRTAPVSLQPILAFTIDLRVLVGCGYAVLMPSLPLPPESSEPLAGLAERVLSAVDAAAEQSPGTFDPERLGLWGHSYGGYTVLGVISQTDRFKAAIASNSISNLTSLYGTFQQSWRQNPEEGGGMNWPAGWAESSQGRMGGAPWNLAERYVRNSPVLQAGRIDTPLLLIHGDQDMVPLSQAEEMFSALYRQNKDAMLVTYWGEDHAIAVPGNVRDMYERVQGWFAKYLGTAETTCVCECDQAPIGSPR